MRLLGIDYGRKKIGLALAQSGFSYPFSVIKYDYFEFLYSKLKKNILEEKIDKVIVGISEGLMGLESQKFGKTISRKLDIPVDFQDETLTTKDVGRLMLDAGIPQKRRKKMEHAFAASLMLQSYIDNLKAQNSNPPAGRQEF